MQQYDLYRYDVGGATAPASTRARTPCRRPAPATPGDRRRPGPRPRAVRRTVPLPGPRPVPAATGTRPAVRHGARPHPGASGPPTGAVTPTPAATPSATPAPPPRRGRLADQDAARRRWPGPGDEPRGARPGGRAGPAARQPPAAAPGTAARSAHAIARPVRRPAPTAARPSTARGPARWPSQRCSTAPACRPAQPSLPGPARHRAGPDRRCARTGRLPAVRAERVPGLGQGPAHAARSRSTGMWPATPLSAGSCWPPATGCSARRAPRYSPVHGEKLGAANPGRHQLPDQVGRAGAVRRRPGRPRPVGLPDRPDRAAAAVRPRPGQRLRRVPLGRAAQAAPHLGHGVPVLGGGPDHAAHAHALARR